MIVYTTWKRNMPNTIDGDQIEIITRYCSFDKSEIDMIEEWAKENIGTLVVKEVQGCETK